MKRPAPECETIEFQPDSLPALFLELAQPNEDGFSRAVSIDEFKGDYEKLRLGNGGSWCREDSSLGRKFNIERGKEGNRIVFIRLHGYKKAPISKPIPLAIRKEIQSRSCVVLGTSNVEVDHKDGRRDDPRLSDASRVTLNDFQPLSKAANAAKRQHCKECRETNARFDAKRLGYPVSQTQGDGFYRGSCVGCFWYDPVAFRRAANA